MSKDYILLDIKFYIENNDDDKYLHNEKRITKKSILKKIKDWFKTDLDHKEIKNLGLPQNIELLSWNLELLKFPNKFKLSYKTSKKLSLIDKEHFEYWIIDLDDEYNYPIEYYRKSYYKSIKLFKNTNKNNNKINK